MPSDSYMELKDLARLDDPQVVQRCVKLKRTHPVKTMLGWSVFYLLLAAVILLKSVYIGGASRSGVYHPPNPSLFPWATTSIFLGVVALGGYFCIQNYYLVDPVEHLLYHHFSFLGLRRRRIVFRQADIVGITAEGKKRTSKYSSYWIYRTVAVGLDGRSEPLTNWVRDGLRVSNSQAIEIARLLGCKSFDAPSETKPVVDRENGIPTLQFNSSKSNYPLWLAIVLIAALIGIILSKYLMNRH